MLQTNNISNVKHNKKNKNLEYAGVHLILEFWGARNINSVIKIEQAFRDAIKASQVTLLNINLHKFSPQGVSGVAVIAESHLSVHTWPEYKYAAFDVFMCGGKDPYKAVAVLKKAFKPTKVEIIEIKRGIRI